MTQTETKTAPTTLQRGEGQNESPNSHEEGMFTVKTTQPIVQLDPCPSWCAGNCEDDYHHTKPVKIHTTDRPLSIQLTFGGEDTEPLISIPETNDVLLTRAQALALAQALTRFADAAKEG